MLVIKIFMCVILADFITGLVHWIEDTYGVPDWPFGLGKNVVEPNIIHHQHPNWMITMSNVIQRNYITAIPASIAIFIAYYFYGWSCWPFATTILIAGFLGNEIHGWNHTPISKLNWFIRFLQDTAIVQTRHQHALHHKKPYNKYYCTLTNLTNPVLELIYFWRTLEFLLLKIFGLKTKRCTEVRNGY